MSFSFFLSLLSTFFLPLFCSNIFMLCYGQFGLVSILIYVYIDYNLIPLCIQVLCSGVNAYTIEMNHSMAIYVRLPFLTIYLGNRRDVKWKVEDFLHFFLSLLCESRIGNWFRLFHIYISLLQNNDLYCCCLRCYHSSKWTWVL